MDIMTHAKFHFNRLMLTLIFGIRASEPPPLGPGERLKRPGLIGLKDYVCLSQVYVHREKNTLDMKLQPFLKR